MNITIRKGVVEDIGEIKECLIDSWVNHARNVPELMDEERMRQSDVERYYQTCFSSGYCYVLVAEIDGSFAGFVRADIQEIASFFSV